MTRTGGIAALGLLAGGSALGQFQGPSSSASPYLTAAPGGPGVEVWAVLTAGDWVNLRPDGASPYLMVGRPDGLGVLAGADGVMTVLMNHELGCWAGITREHGSEGAFVSRWRIDARAAVGGAPNPGFLRVLHGEDQDLEVEARPGGPCGGAALDSLCSGDLAAPAAYLDPATGLGTPERIFLGGEEYTGGRVIAHLVEERVGRQLDAWNPLQGSWENIVARPWASPSTVVVGTSDGGDNRVFVYVGAKRASGTALERAGLVGGTAYGVQVVSGGVELASESPEDGVGTPGAPAMSARFELRPGRAGTGFLRPEDGAWDPGDPRDFYFATSDQLDTTDGGSGLPGQVGASRLWRLRFDDPDAPEAGGEIRAIVDGSGGPDKPNMLDNVCVVRGRDGRASVIAQEDTGYASHLAKVWLIDAETGAREVILRADRARFGDVDLPATPPFIEDEESSGVVEAEGALGKGWFLATVQDHHGGSWEVVEGGQLLAFYLPRVARLCPVDFNADGFTDFFDYDAFVACYEGAGCPRATDADFNGDGFADFFDYDAFVGAFESGC